MSATAGLKPLSTRLKRASAGLNLCHDNASALFKQRPELECLQIHPEHLIQEAGGTYREQLDELRREYSVVLHGYGLSLGSSGPLDKQYLLLVRQLLREHPEAVFSDYLSWSSLSQHHFHVLLPLIQNGETVEYLAERIEEAQDVIGSPILLENISSYMRFRDSDMSEIEFINAITERCGCYVRLNVNNFWINAKNFQEDPWKELSQLRGDSVRGFHLEGCATEAMGNGLIQIDYRKEGIHQEVWDLYQQSLTHFGAWPTIVDWDNDAPSLERAMDQVQLVNKFLRPYAFEKAQ
jgi:uncharacterized protein (UPF0276 family)